MMNSGYFMVRVGWPATAEGMVPVGYLGAGGRRTRSSGGWFEGYGTRGN